MIDIPQNGATGSTIEFDQKYALLEEGTNKLIGWYCNSVHAKECYKTVKKMIDGKEQQIQEKYFDTSVLPKGCFEVSDKEWQEALSISANFYDKKQKKFIFKDFRTSEEIKEQELSDKILNADRYLKDTDWVKDYLLRHELGLDTIAEDSEKWKIIKKREEYKEFLKSL